MDQAPVDNEQRNIIDKLAQFVARNGPEFEQMTKNKQRDNPKFSFLFGGEYYHYYTYKVNAEQAILRQRNSSFEGQGYGGGQDRGYGGGGGQERGYGGGGGGGQDRGYGGGGGQDRGYGHPGWSSTPSGASAPTQSYGHQWASSDMGGAPPPPQMPRPSPSPQRQAPRPLMDIQPFGPIATPVSSSPSMSSPSVLPAQKLSELRDELARLSTEQQTLRDQIGQSEQNLNAQRIVTQQQEEKLSVEAVRSAKWERLEVLANDTGVELDEMETVMHPIVESCSKDSISSGKIWIFQKAVSHETNKLIAHYLAYRVTREDAPFTHKLYLVYLMNDVLHHCVRKGAEELKQSLESVAVEMFCSASLAAGDDHQLQKLSKLIRLWEDKSIFSASTLSKMKMAAESWAAYKNQLKETYAEAIEAAVAHLRQTYNNYQQQHLNFVAHANGTIRTLESQKIHVQQQIQASEAEAGRQQQLQLQRQEEDRMYQQQQHSYSQSHQMQPQPDFQQQAEENAPLALPQPKPTRSSRWDTGAKPAAAPASATSEGGWPGPPTPGAFPASFLAPPPALLPDLSRPPPGFAMPPPVLDEAALVPSLPYYDLPAGLMVTMVKMEDSGYKSLDPKNIRLPPPAPPTERLMQALEMFYAPPSHDRPRDPEGWELTGLYEWTRDKLAAVAAKADDVRLGRRERSPTASPEPYSRSSTPEKGPKTSDVTTQPPKVPEEKKRKRYRSRSRTRSRSRGSTPERGRRSRSHSPDGDYALPSYLTKRSPSPSPSGGGGGRRQRPRPDQDDEDDEATAPRAGFGSASASGGPAVPLDSSNKGHQMMQRMGWKGSGLGSSETGIVEPVSGGEVRDKQDMYRGVGLGNDPFDAFRKAKSGSFYTRMKDRDVKK